jgi:hypothetical protein
MVRVLFFLALVIAAASAFVSPAQRSGTFLFRGICVCDGILLCDASALVRHQSLDPVHVQWI